MLFDHFISCPYMLTILLQCTLKRGPIRMHEDLLTLIVRSNQSVSVHARHNRLSVALSFLKKFLFRKAITSCAGRQLNMPKHTSITFLKR